MAAVLTVHDCPAAKEPITRRKLFQRPLSATNGGAAQIGVTDHLPVVYDPNLSLELHIDFAEVSASAVAEAPGMHPHPDAAAVGRSAKTVSPTGRGRGASPVANANDAGAVSPSPRLPVSLFPLNPSPPDSRRKKGTDNGSGSGRKKSRGRRSTGMSPTPPVIGLPGKGPVEQTPEQREPPAARIDPCSPPPRLQGGAPWTPNPRISKRLAGFKDTFVEFQAMNTEINQIIESRNEIKADLIRSRAENAQLRTRLREVELEKDAAASATPGPVVVDTHAATLEASERDVSRTKPDPALKIGASFVLQHKATVEKLEERVAELEQSIALLSEENGAQRLDFMGVSDRLDDAVSELQQAETMRGQIVTLLSDRTAEVTELTATDKLLGEENQVQRAELANAMHCVQEMADEVQEASSELKATQRRTREDAALIDELQEANASLAQEFQNVVIDLTASRKALGMLRAEYGVAEQERDEWAEELKEVSIREFEMARAAHATALEAEMTESRAQWAQIYAQATSTPTKGDAANAAAAAKVLERLADISLTVGEMKATRAAEAGDGAAARAADVPATTFETAPELLLIPAGIVESTGKAGERGLTSEGLDDVISTDLEAWSAYRSQNPAGAVDDGIIPLVERLVSCLCVKLQHEKAAHEQFRVEVEDTFSRMAAQQAHQGVRSRQTTAPAVAVARARSSFDIPTWQQKVRNLAPKMNRKWSSILQRASTAVSRHPKRYIPKGAAAASSQNTTARPEEQGEATVGDATIAAWSTARPNEGSVPGESPEIDMVGFCGDGIIDVAVFDLDLTGSTTGSTSVMAQDGWNTTDGGSLSEDGPSTAEVDAGLVKAEAALRALSQVLAR